MKYKIIAFLSLAALMVSCTVTLRTEDITPPDDKGSIQTAPADEDGGIAYALPKTGLRFIISAEKTEKERGEFYLYSERYLGLKDVILEDAVEWKIKNIELEPFGVANADEVFQIACSDNAGIPSLVLSEDGVLLAMNCDLPKKKECATVCKKAALVNNNVPYTEEMLLANSSAKMAQEAANYIYRLRESRTALLCGDLNVLPPDGDAYAMSLNNINDLEEQFLSLFKGKETSTTVTKTIEIVPDQIKDKEVLFRFSTFNGMVASDDLSGSPFYITMQSKDASLKTETPCDSAGLFYKKPLLVTVKIFDGTTEVLSKNVLMGQFGALQTLPSGTVNNEMKIQFYPTTGAIKAIMK